MPVKSQAQRRFMFATEEGKTDVDPSVGREFIDASHGRTGLPNRVGPGKKKVNGASKKDPVDDMIERAKKMPKTDSETASQKAGTKNSVAGLFKPRLSP